VARRPTTIAGADLADPLRELRVELDLPGEFPAAALAEAEQAAHSWGRAGRSDATGVDLVTLDPPGSRDLDQAFSLQAEGSGFRFAYAIADVAAFVSPDGELAAEARRRGETLYLPDGRVPLYPVVLSEAAASLLPDGERPAVLWQMELDETGEPRTVEVRRAVIRTRQQLSYPQLQNLRPDVAALLQRVGELRLARERKRGGVSLNVPEQEVIRQGGGWRLDYRVPLPAEAWNAQLSLLTGMAAAKLMIGAKIGLLRVMPAPPHHVRVALRRRAAALGVPWPQGAGYAEVIRGLDASIPAHAAMLRVAAAVFRGAHYVAFDGEVPQEVTHSAVAASYAHATAPLRRLADRYVSELCLAISAGSPTPQWVRDELPGLPRTMAAADGRGHRVDHAVVDLAEALLLQDRVGEVFRGVVVAADGERGTIQIRDPAVQAELAGTALPVGHEVDARLLRADVRARMLTFELASPPPGGRPSP
jgi:exoribonuclease R